MSYQEARAVVLEAAGQAHLGHPIPDAARFLAAVAVILDYEMIRVP